MAQERRRAPYPTTWHSSKQARGDSAAAVELRASAPQLLGLRSSPSPDSGSISAPGVEGCRVRWYGRPTVSPWIRSCPMHRSRGRVPVAVVEPIESAAHFAAASATGAPPGHHRFEGTPSHGLGIDGSSGSGCMTTVVA